MLMPSAPKWVPRLVPLLFICVIAGLTVCGSKLLLAKAVPTAEVSIVSSASAQARLESDELKSQAGDLKTQSEMLKAKEDDLKWILGFILGAAALFAVAQAGSTWFSAHSFTKQAEDGLSRMEKMEKDAKTSYPLFAETEARRTQALESLKRILPDEGFNWQRHFYERLPLIQRQELLAVERFLSYEIAGQNADNVGYARTLRKLAQFYFSKFIYEKGRGFGYFDDLERAEYFLGLALRRIGPAFYISNDLGNVHLESFKARMEYLAERLPPEQVKSEAISSFLQAVRDFEDSIGIQPRQLRAHYNLAVIEADHRHNEQQAIEWLKKGLQYPNWEHEPVVELTCAALFNCACYHARLSSNKSADPEQAQAQIQECIESLRKAAEIGQISPGDVEREYGFNIGFSRQGSGRQLITHNQQGDLFTLTQSANEETKSLLAELKPKLSTNFRGNSSGDEGSY